MIDTLVRLLPEARAAWDGELQARVPARFALVTLHRPSNVDDPATLAALPDALIEISGVIPLVFPVHPRARQRITDFGLAARLERIHLMEPLGYVEFLALQQHAALVITHSGGIQEETTYLGVPCLTVRENTERPVTISIGSNVLVGHNFPSLVAHAIAAAEGRVKPSAIPPMWDGRAGERIAADLVERAL
jgi:UDP-N-acetylglucosamine 2-epimerase (non-hydrolysing)